jgi:hypothetical protein
MEGISCVIVALGVFNIITNIVWFKALKDTDDFWLHQVLNISDKQLNNYKELLQSIVNGEDKKDERDNVL